MQQEAPHQSLSLLPETSCRGLGGPPYETATRGVRQLEVDRKEVALTADELPLCELGEVTTLMLRHVPHKFTHCTLVEVVNALGFAGTYDFLYIPYDTRRHSSRGIAFINFASMAHAIAFASLVDGKPLDNTMAGTAVEVFPAKVQGFDANVEHHLDILLSPLKTNKPLLFTLTVEGALTTGGVDGQEVQGQQHMPVMTSNESEVSLTSWTDEMSSSSSSGRDVLAQGARRSMVLGHRLKSLPSNQEGWQLLNSTILPREAHEFPLEWRSACPCCGATLVDPLACQSCGVAFV